MIPATDKELSGEQRQKIEEFMKMIGPPKIDPPYTKLPPEAQKQRLWARSQPKHFAADDDPYWGEEFAEIYTARQKQEHPLGDIPLVVLVGGKEDKSPPGFSAAEWTKLNEEKRQQKIGSASLSRNGKVVVDPQSGHHIQLDNPELVIRSIREVVEAARRGTRLTGSVHTRDK